MAVNNRLTREFGGAERINARNSMKYSETQWPDPRLRGFMVHGNSPAVGPDGVGNWVLRVANRVRFFVYIDILS